MEIHRAGWACIGMVKGSLSFPSMRGGDSLPPPRMKRLIWVIRCEIYAHGPNAWVPVALLNTAICVVASDGVQPRSRGDARAASARRRPRVGFIVTNLARPVERLVAFYNHRGTCEQYIKEGKAAVKWTRLSCRSFAANAVRLQLHALAYNLGNFMRTLLSILPFLGFPFNVKSSIARS
jgi:hypothetical protein